MGNIITFTSREIFGLDKLLIKEVKPSEKKRLVPRKYIGRRKGLYSLLSRI